MKLPEPVEMIDHQEGPAVVRGEWGAMLYDEAWTLFHIPSQVALGDLPGHRLATVAHALRDLASLPPCPTTAVARLVVRLSDGDPPATRGARWVQSALAIVDRYHAAAWVTEGGDVKVQVA